MLSTITFFLDSRNNYKISHGTVDGMPYSRACLISGCELAMFDCIWSAAVLQKPPANAEKAKWP